MNAVRRRDRTWRWLGVLALAAWISHKYLPVLFFCVEDTFASTTELSRIESSDHVVDVVLVRTRSWVPGSSPYYEVLLMTSSSRARGSYDRILEATRLENVELAWQAPRLLEIEYSHSCISTFQNWWCHWKLTGVTIALAGVWLLYKYYILDALLFVVLLIVAGLFFTGTTELARVPSPIARWRPC